MADLTRASILDAMRLVAASAPPRFDSLIGSGQFMKKIAAGIASDYLAPNESPLEPASVQTLFGFKVHTMPMPLRRPVLQISPDFEHCSPEFRAAWNQWALERFGTEEVCYMVDSQRLAEVLGGIQRNFDRRIVRVITGHTP